MNYREPALPDTNGILGHLDPGAGVLPVEEGEPSRSIILTLVLAVWCNHRCRYQECAVAVTRAPLW